MRSKEPATIADFARELVRRELATPGAVLDRVIYRRAGEIAASKANKPRFASGCIESALDYLVSKGLVEEAEHDGHVTAANPQRYRWTRQASADALGRVADPRERCGGPGCRTLLLRGPKHRATGPMFCGDRCRSRAQHRENIEAS